MRPYWYRSQLPEVATQFSTCFSSGRPPNLHLLPSFINQDVTSDGVSLTPVAGLHYILHVFDQSEALLTLSEADQVQKAETVHEAVRYHDDRLAYLEHDHAMLFGKVSHKMAVDAEFADWVQNRSEEEWLSIRGLPRLKSGLSSQEWQYEAKRQVRDLIRLVLQINKVNLSFDVMVVVNPWRRRLTGPTWYNVRLNSVEAATRVRELFSGFFRGVNPLKKPLSLKNVSIRNKITHESQVRIAIMRQLGEIYQASNPGASFKVLGYQPRPLITITPPAKSSNPSPRTLNFIQAITSLPAHFSDENLIQIFMIVGENNRGKLQELFCVLDDDDHDRCLELVKKHYQDRRQEHRQDTRSRSGPGPGPVSSHAGVALGPGDGMEQQSGIIPSLLLPAPPPPPSHESPANPKPVEKSKTTARSSPSRTAARKRPGSDSESSSPPERFRDRSRDRSRERYRDKSRDKSRSRSRERSRKKSKSSKSGRSGKSSKSSKKRSRRSPSYSSSGSGSGSDSDESRSAGSRKK